MSLYPGPVPGTAAGLGGQHGGAAHLDLTAAGLMTGFDPLDMALPMDLDSVDPGDLTSVGMGPDQTFMSMQSQQQQMQQQQQQQAGMSSMQGSLGNGNGNVNHSNNTNDNTTSSARPPESTVNNLSGAGAGPLPTGFGMPAPSNSITLTEFTKRRNWSQRVIEELKDFLHILTPDGRILYVSPSCKTITGYEPHTLIGKFIGEYVHPDDSGIFMREFNESIASGNSLRFFYRFKTDDGTYLIFECDGHPHISSEPSNAGGYNDASNGNMSSAGLCRGFFMMARPYPTKNAALLDSFLEHKIENERLMKRIDELRREEKEETTEQDRLLREQTSSQTGAMPSESPHGVSRDSAGSPEPRAPTPNYQGMPPPAKPSISNTALTRQNLDSALSSQKPDSIADKMSRYEANSTHLESIELLTGLRYRDGERSHGISTGDTSPALIRGDAGIAILLDRDRDGKKDKKKLKVADEYVCSDCGTLDSPEWRKGPKGPKTLCNACGLRWAKKEKKKSGDDGPRMDSPGGGAAQQQQGQSQQASFGGQGLQHGHQGLPLPGQMQPPGMPMRTSTDSS